jgi:hypothetical protein
MRGHYQNEHVGAAPTDRQYWTDLNHQTDLLFWSETGYKFGQKLDPHDPADQRMMATWLLTRDRVKRSMSPQTLRQNSAARAVFDANTRLGQPFYVYSSGASWGEALVPFADMHKAFAYGRARLEDSDYVTMFSTADPKWPGPVFESYRPRVVAAV